MDLLELIQAKYPQGTAGKSDLEIATELNAPTVPVRRPVSSPALGAQLQAEGGLAALVAKRNANPPDNDAEALLMALEQGWEVDLDASGTIAALETKSAAVDALADALVSPAKEAGLGGVHHLDVAKALRPEQEEGE